MARQSRRPIGLAQLRGFEAAARHLSFTMAAEELHLTQSSISRQVQTLEEEIGKPLFVRRTRELGLTSAGQALYRVVRTAIGDIDRTVAELRGTAQRKRVTLTTWPSFASLWLVPRLAAFARVQPDIDIRIESTDAMLDLEDEGIDFAVRYCRDESAPHNATVLMDEEITPAMSPSLLERLGPLSGPEDLARATLLVLEDGLQSAIENSWERWLTLADVPNLQPAGRLLFNYIDQSMQAAARGQGVVLARTPFLRDFAERGELLAPFALRMPSRYRYFLVENPATEATPHARAFRDWLIGQTQRPNAAG